MAFYICFLLAVAVTASGIAYYSRNKDILGLIETPVRIVLILALADTCILYIPWFLYMWNAEKLHFGRGVLFIPFMIVRLMQTVSLDADYEAALEIIEFAKISGVHIHFLEFYTVLLSYVSVLVPVSGILTIMSFFGNQIGFGIAASRLSRKKYVYVFNGVGERNMQLAASIRKRPDYNRHTCSFLYCNVREDPSIDIKRKIRETGGWYTADYPSVLLRLVPYKKDRNMDFFLLEDDEQNFNDAIGILKAAGAIHGKSRRRGIAAAPGFDADKWEEADRVTIHLILESDELAAILDAQKKYGIFVRIMDVEQMYLQDLYRRLPLFSCLRPGQKTMQLMIYGKGPVAEEALMRALWMGRIASASLKVWYISEEAEALRNKLRIACPALFEPALAGGERFELYFETITETGQLYRAIGDDGVVDGAAGGPAGGAADGPADSATGGHPGAADARRQTGLQKVDFLGADYLILAGESDEENIRTAMWFRTWFARQIAEDRMQPLIAVLVRDGKRAEQAENLCIQESKEPYDLHVFGTEVQLFTAENILFSRLAQSLYRIQLSYSLDDPADQPTARQKSDAWMALNQSIYNYRSSEASALYIVNRLFDSGALLECLRRRGGAVAEIAAATTELATAGAKASGAAASGLAAAGTGTAHRDVSNGATPVLAAMGRGRTANRSGEYTGYAQACLWVEALDRAGRGDSTLLNEIMDTYEQKIAEPEAFERLSRTEHRRWIAYMACNGWVALPKEKMRQWMADNGGSHKDYLRLRHACMAGWDELEELSLIKTEGKDKDKFKDLDRLMVKGVRSFVV